jgi:hypothetical protein
MGAMPAPSRRFQTSRRLPAWACSAWGGEDHIRCAGHAHACPRQGRPFTFQFRLMAWAWHPTPRTSLSESAKTTGNSAYSFAQIAQKCAQGILIERGWFSRCFFNFQVHLVSGVAWHPWHPRQCHPPHSPAAAAAIALRTYLLRSDSSARFKSGFTRAAIVGKCLKASATDKRIE